MNLGFNKFNKEE